MSVEEMRWGPWLEDMERISTSLDDALIKIEDDPKDPEAIEQIKIELHSAKGLLDSIGLKTSTQTIYEIEETVHRQQDELEKELINMLNKALSKINELIVKVRNEKPSQEEVDEIDKAIGFESILVKFDNEYKVEISIKAQKSLISARALGIINSIKRFAVIKSSNPSTEDLYLDAKFDTLSMEISSREDIDEVRNRIQNLPGVDNALVEKLKREGDDQADASQNLIIKVPLDLIRALESGLATLSVHVEALKSEVDSTKGIEELNAIDRTFDRIQSDITKMRKVPLDSITSTLPSMVRRLSKSEGKNAELFVQGRFATLDRSLANYLIDPITQIIRNAISHGIEKPVERREKGKNPFGRIVINATNDRDKIRIEITDDGRGIDKEQLLEQAKKLDIDVNPEEMSDEDIYGLIFHKGFSNLTDANKISGRGLGLYAAKERLSQIGGNLIVSSEKDSGTTFTIEISDPDALNKNFIFAVNENNYAIPSSEVDQIVIVDPSQLTIHTKSRATYRYKRKILPVTILRNLIDKNETEEELKLSNNEVMLVCRGRRSLVGLIIDRIVDERLVNIRPLNPLLKDYKLFNGTITGRDQEVILVVNPTAIA